MKTLAIPLVAALGLHALQPAAPARSADRSTPGADQVTAWQVDPVHSSIVFRIKHANASWFYGTFAKVEGKLSLDPAALDAARVEIVIDAASVRSNNDKRDQHLRSPDFFDAKQFPEIRFVSRKVAAKGDGLLVEGELELRGEKQPLTVAVEKTGEGELDGPRAGYHATFTIQRSKFGMNYGLAKSALGDEVELTVSLAVVPSR